MRLTLQPLFLKLSQFNISSLLVGVAVVGKMAVEVRPVVIAQAYRVNHLAAAQAQSQQ
jgi:hypothetical protein